MVDFKVSDKIKKKEQNVMITEQIDFIKKTDDSGFVDFEILDNEEDIILQGAGLLTIYQKGNDLVYQDRGNEWAEVLLGEAFCLSVLENLEQTLNEIFPVITMSYRIENIDDREVLVIHYEANL